MGNESKAIDYSVMLADLYAKRAGIDAAIAGLIAASGGVYVAGHEANAGVPFAANGSGDRQPTELPRGAFLGKSLPAAVKLYLSAVMKKQTIKEITAALREGGVETRSPSFENVITGCLNRMKSNGEILRFKDGWGLPEFYPEHLRRSLSQGIAAKSKTTGKKTKKAKKTAKPAKGDQQGKPQTPQVGAAGDRIREFLTNNLGVFYSSKEIAEHLPGLQSNVVAMMMSKLAPKHGLEKSPDRKYRVGFNNVQPMPKAG